MSTDPLRQFTTMFSIVFHFIILSLHVQPLMEAITPTTDPFLGYTIYTYISFSFVLSYTLFLYLKLNVKCSIATVYIPPENGP
jgi:hypothetical protein